jgi:hypothetical protein
LRQQFVDDALVDQVGGLDARVHAEHAGHEQDLRAADEIGRLKCG